MPQNINSPLLSAHHTPTAVYKAVGGILCRDAYIAALQGKQFHDLRAFLGEVELRLVRVPVKIEERMNCRGADVCALDIHIRSSNARWGSRLAFEPIEKAPQVDTREAKRLPGARGRLDILPQPTPLPMRIWSIAN